MELCQVICGDVVRSVPWGCFYRDMLLVSGSNEAGLGTPGVCVEYKELQYITPHGFCALATQYYGFKGSNDVRARQAGIRSLR